MSTTSISVIIPAYHQAPFLAEAVTSVFAQGYAPLQVVVVNNDGGEEVAGVLAQLAKQFPNLEIIKTEESSLAAALAAGLAQAIGEYILRLDGDDYIPEGYLEKLATALDAAPPEVGYAYADARQFGAFEGWIRGRKFSAAALLPENYINSASLMRRKMLDACGNIADLPVYEDWDCYLTLLEAGYRGVYVPDTFVWYRQKEEGGRNTVTAAMDRAARASIRARHPKLYRPLGARLSLFYWRLSRRIRYYKSQV